MSRIPQTLFTLAVLLGAVACSSDDGVAEADSVDAGAGAETQSPETGDADTDDAGSGDAAESSVGDETLAYGDSEDAGIDSESTDAGSDGDLDAYYPSGTTRDDLPADRSDRIELLGDWLDLNVEESSGYSIGEFNGTVDIEYSVNVETADAAAGLCPVYADLTRAYLFDVDVDSFTLAGWVIDAEGSYGPADWEPVVCER